MHSRALIFNQTSTQIVVGLFQEGSLIFEHTVPYKEASAQLIPAVQRILSLVDVRLAELSYLACNVGPAPFTTLRTIVVTVNGLGLGANLPLIGINGLLSLLKERHHAKAHRTYAILHAFGNEVYYGFYEPATSNLECRLIAIDEALELVMSHARINTEKQIYIVSTMVHYKAALEEAGIFYAELNEATKSPSLASIAAEAEYAWRQGCSIHELVPYYGKSINIKGYVASQDQ